MGRASVIDGDTIEIHGARIRLEGIDAPESRQICTEKATGQTVRCGQKAALFLADLLGTSTVTCTERGKDRYRRVLARCSVRGEDVGSAMVLFGWAMAFTRYSRAYVVEEEAARTAGEGLWATEFIPPWEWRAAQRGR